MSIRYSVISIGALSRNRFWNEKTPVRAAHATTTLIQAGSTFLVDPGLPPEILARRLDERSGLKPEQVDAVFLTTLRPVHRRSLALFSKATWLVHAPELEAMRDNLADVAAREQEDEAVRRLVREEMALLERFRPADERLDPQVHLYPTPGITPGAAALLLPLPGSTVLIAGDAVISRDYYEAGQVYEQDRKSVV